MTTKQPPAKTVRATPGSMPPAHHTRDVDVLRALEREAIDQETVRFLKGTPDVRDRELEGAIEAWTLVHGVASETHFLEGGVHQRLIQQVERHLSGSFYDRLLRWSERNERKDDKWARRLARWFARRAFPVAWRETLEFLDRSARAHQELQAQGRSAAAVFAETHAANLNPKPTQAEIGDLARRLFESLFLPDGPDESAMVEAATKNPILRGAMRAYEEWRVNVNALSQQNGPTRIGYVAGSDPDSETETEKELYREAKKQNVVTYSRTFAFYWPRLVHEWQVKDAAALGVRRALAVALKDEAQSQTPEAAARLREVVATELARNEFGANVVWPWPSEHEEVESEGMAAPLARLLTYLRSRFCPSDKGPAWARLKEIEQAAKEKFANWKAQERLEGIDPPESPWQALTPTLAATVVAQLVWFHHVGGELERAAAGTTALVATVHSGLGSIWSADTQQQELTLLGSDGFSVAWFAVDSAEDASRIVGARSTLTFQRLIRYLPQTALELRRRTGRDEADIIIEGGLSKLAELIGAHSKKAAEEVKQALQMGQTMRQQWADGSEAAGLWTYITTPEAPGRQAQIIITLSPILRPGFVHKLPEGAARTLVPVVPLPAFVGRTNDHAKQASLQWETLALLAAGRAETAEAGGVTITDAEWRRMAGRVGLPSSTLPTVLKKWEGEFLERVGGDRWFLANTPIYAPARAHLLDQAKMSAIGARRGRAAAAKKRGEKRKAIKSKEK